MKQILRDLMPPILDKIIAKSGLKSLISSNHKVYNSFEEALKQCTNGAYEENELVEVILKKTKRFNDKLKTEVVPVWESTSYILLSVVNPILENGGKQINVLDFGGACGAHYFHLRSLINSSLKLNWVVVETPTMVKYAKELENDELKFFDNFSEAKAYLGNVDFIHTSGTLQCVDKPKQYLDYILDCNAKWILFSRLGLSKKNKDVITIHTSKLSWNGIGELPEGHQDKWVKYPFTFSSETNFLNSIKSKYEIKAHFHDSSGMFEVNGEEIVGYGVLCKSIAA